MGFFGELKRRNVIRVGLAYVLMSWVLLQIADFALDLVDAPNWVIQTLSIIVLLGLPVALFFAWAFELTPEGVKREHEVDRSQSITPTTGRKLDRVIIIVLLAAVGWLLADRLWLSSQPVAEPAVVDAVPSERVSEELLTQDGTDQKSIAVLPFVAMSSGEDDGYFADGLTEEILNSLAQLPELLVTSRTSSFAMKGDESPLEDIAQRLRVDHVVEGSVRRSGDRLRITAQLIRAEDGFHLWSDTYDSRSTDAIAVQEDIAEKIAGALDVVLDEDSRNAMKLAGLRDVDAFIAYQKGLELFDDAHAGQYMQETLREANSYFEQVLERVPETPQAWSHRADLYSHTLMDEAIDSLASDFAATPSAEALESLQHDLSQAIRYARNDEERETMRFDLAFLVGDWKRMDLRLESLITHQGCELSDWAETLANIFGYGARYVPRMEKQVKCDPLPTRNRVTLAATHVWADQADKGLEILVDLLPDERTEHSQFVRLFGLLVAGHEIDTESFINEVQLSANVESFMRMVLTAKKGDVKEAHAARDAYIAQEDDLRYRELVAYSMNGDRQKANELAAILDRHPQGYLALILVMGYCVCSDPWDLEYTPNFQAMIESSGLEWPPFDLIEFPLKTAAEQP